MQAIRNDRLHSTSDADAAQLAEDEDDEDEDGQRYSHPSRTALTRD